ncbi:hypothetical protein [Sinorhizobium meliloti]|uniref:hypothetical protein n=1 Tax=Rhizobium meliloti TaxID=382 RepID=UPI000FD84D15|nr:hypothetical protein [Sinorhizobium meliloti]RVO48173.1 hypothetical protein CN092_31705 [Sinorhizobium meliloti]
MRAYLARLAANFQPVLPNLSSIEVNRSDVRGVEAICSGPAGEQPCSILQQEIVDSGRGATIPLLEELRNRERLPAEDIATACAEKAGLDVVNFSSCAGGRVILSPRHQEMIDCATQSEDTKEFAKCAAPLMGVKVSKRQEKLATCAVDSQGASDEFVNCAGDALLSRQASTALRCYREAEGNTRTFAECAAASIVGDNMTEEQKRAIACLARSDADVIGCATEQAGLSEEQKAMVDCAVRSEGASSGFINCAGSAVVDRYLGRDAQTALQCAVDSDRPEDFAVCAGTGILGQNATKEQRIALTCAADSGGDVEQMAVCAGANMLNMKMGLNAEQQIAVQCLVSTGGQPYAAAGCMATRLTARELTKCFTDGIGGDGCFGDNNDLIGRDGWTARTLRQIGGGPNSVINRPDQIWGGNNSFVRNPGQIWGGDNSFVRNLDQIWGGPNSVFNNPGQLAPEPVQVGRIGNTRICLPWC